MAVGDKKIKELPLLDTSVNDDIVIVSDTSETLDNNKTKGQTKQNFLKEVREEIENKVEDKNYSQEFTGLDTIIVIHNLGKRPSVTVIDSAGEEVIGSVQHNSLNQLTVTFTSATGGIVYCN